MVKKKMPESENTMGDDQPESTVNKDYTDYSENHEPDEDITTDVDETAEVKSGPEGATGEETDKRQQNEKALEEKLAESQDKYLRLSAEFDNYRKRTLKEKMDIYKYAGEDLLKKILPLMDDFERALKHMENTTECKGIREGVDLIYCKFSEFLRQEGVTEIEALNGNLDVDLHDAVAKVPVPEEERKGKIVEVISKGYYLKDKVLRHSKVVIGE